jgi:[acyl-carrier-protein] S-malonyltransferase
MADFASILDSLLERPPGEGEAWVFPGQGSQEPGMGLDLSEGSQAARDIYRQADEMLGFPLSRLCFQGPDDELRRTENAQPAIFVTSLACLAAALEAGALSRPPQVMAGHSLGEYTALVAAGSLGFAKGLALVRQRGHLMQAAGEETPGAMTAVMRLEPQRIEEICHETSAEVCNYNSPQQIVIGGAPAAVERAGALIKAEGGRAVPLNVSGAFHSSLMAPAAARLSSVIAQTEFSAPRVPVLANSSAEFLADAAGIRQELETQLTSTVLWQQSVVRMSEAGVTSVIEIGPGQVLTGLVRRIDDGISTRSISGLADLKMMDNER